MHLSTSRAGDERFSKEVYFSTSRSIQDTLLIANARHLRSWGTKSDVFCQLTITRSKEEADAEIAMPGRNMSRGRRYQDHDSV